MPSNFKVSSDFYRGQEVTIGKYGAKLMVIEVRDHEVICVNVKTCEQQTYSPSQLFKL